MALTKQQRITILQKGIVENGGRKPNKGRRMEVDRIISEDLSEQFTFVTVEVDNANSLKTYIYNRIREDLDLRLRTYGFRYVNEDGTDGPRVVGGSTPPYSAPYKVKIIRGEDKSLEDMKRRDHNKRMKQLSKRAESDNINILRG